MATVKLNGLDDYISTIQNLSDNYESIAKQALYEGAGVMADALKANIDALPAVNEIENIKAYKNNDKMHLSKKQKKGLIESMGISKFEDDGKRNITAKIGFDGYNDVKTKKYPQGQPNQMIARIVESGSSYMDKTPFIRKTINANKKKVETAMKEKVENLLNKEMKR